MGINKKINAVIDTPRTQEDAFLIAQADDSSLYNVTFDSNTAVYSVEFNNAINRQDEKDHVVNISPIVSNGPVYPRQSQQSMVPMSFATYKKVSNSQLQIEGGKKVTNIPAAAAQISLAMDLNKKFILKRPQVDSANFTLPGHDTANEIYFTTRPNSTKATATNTYSPDEDDFRNLTAAFNGKDQNKTLYFTTNKYPKTKALRNTNNMSMYHLGVVEVAREMVTYLGSASSIASNAPANWINDEFDE